MSMPSDPHGFNPSHPPGYPQPQFQAPTPKPEMKKPKKWPWITGGLVTLLVIAGILVGGDRDESKSTSSAATTTALRSPVSDASTPGGARTKAQTQQFPLGETQTTVDGAEVTPLTLENPTDRVPDSAFSRSNEPGAWTVLDAELCAGARQISKTGYGFTLVDAANREYKSYDSSSQPFKPTISGGKLAPGECARGYVNFQLPAGVEIAAVRWEYPGDGGPMRWAK
ncbi:hypothetical protein [Rhodococcus sp. ARC_M6]|uniref:hypothetical protein n=1 Tax=Rhodococcus sp. ARC_M6 TaxID=2928852 RepID=UPI001FB2A810|nr:hypothetical protein [Rhodococcus sp. ARC_M6]MCJ0907020.1 hypothetical protein [Rhodococcus sp. ARC_M6]